MKNIIILLLCSLLSISVFGQETFDIRFLLSSVDCVTEQACYDVQVKSSTGSTWGLAGQNYRIYYDYDKAQYQAGTSTLPAQYGAFNLVSDVGPVDASGFSTVLGFEPTLGFLNYAIDLNDVTSGGVDVGSQWTTTSNLCFSVSPSVIADPNECLELIWARDGLTNSLATAFVEISEWVSDGVTTATVGSGYDDLDSSDGEGACFTQACGVTASIADATFNEDDGTQCAVITLSSPAQADITIDYAFASGSAQVGSDVSATAGSVVIDAGSTMGTVCFDIVDDSEVEGAESFSINITSSDVVFTDDAAIVTIIDNDVACNAQAPTLFKD